MHQLTLQSWNSTAIANCKSPPTTRKYHNSGNGVVIVTHALHCANPGISCAKYCFFLTQTTILWVGAGMNKIFCIIYCLSWMNSEWCAPFLNQSSDCTWSRMLVAAPLTAGLRLSWERSLRSHWPRASQAIDIQVTTVPRKFLAALEVCRPNDYWLSSVWKRGNYPSGASRFSLKWYISGQLTRSCYEHQNLCFQFIHLLQVSREGRCSIQNNTAIKQRKDGCRTEETAFNTARSTRQANHGNKGCARILSVRNGQFYCGVCRNLFSYLGLMFCHGQAHTNVKSKNKIIKGAYSSGLSRISLSLLS